MSLASRFTSSRLSSLSIIQGILLQGETNKLHFFSTNLSSYFHTFIKTNIENKFKLVIEPKKILEFVSLLPAGNLEIEIKEKQVTINLGKTKGVFPVLESKEFPLPPNITEKGQKIKANLLVNNLPLVLFASSSDESRPVLTGVKFLSQDEELTMVATDGFRLSLVKIKKEFDLPAVILPGDFLNEVARFIKNEEVYFNYSPQEKAVSFKIEDSDFYSRLIEGEYPPFERVIPSEKKTTIKLDKEEFLRNIKIISVFARDLSNIVIIQTNKNGIQIRPKNDRVNEDMAFQEAEIKGEEQKIAFNFKFLLDLLNHLPAKELIIELLRSDAPAIFKTDDNPNFLHIIMPVRIQE